MIQSHAANDAYMQNEQVPEIVPEVRYGSVRQAEISHHPCPATLAGVVDHADGIIWYSLLCTIMVSWQLVLYI